MFLSKKRWRKLANKVLRNLFCYSNNWWAEFTDYEFRISNSDTGNAVRRVDLWARWFSIRNDLHLFFEIVNDDQGTVHLRYSLPWLVRGGISLDMRNWQWTEEKVGYDGARSWGYRIGRTDFEFNWGYQLEGVEMAKFQGWTFSHPWTWLNGTPVTTVQAKDTIELDYVQNAELGYPTSGHTLRLQFTTKTIKWPRWWKPDVVIRGCTVSADEPPRTGPKPLDRIYSRFFGDVVSPSEAVQRYRTAVTQARKENQLPASQLGLVNRTA